MKQKLIYYENLDGLRGIAALMVLVFHFFTNPITDYVETDIFRKITEVGQHGVSLFFVLSGFVITRILINNRNDNNYFQRFYWRRALRILPLYYGFLIIWYFAAPFILDGEAINKYDATIPTFSEQVPFYCYLQNFEWLTGFNASGPGHYWTLAIEEHFYLFWPLIVFITPPRYLKGLIISVIIAIIPLKIYFISSGLPINKTTFTRFDQILFGALLAHYEISGAFQHRRKYFQNLFKYILVGMLPLAVLIYYGQRYFPNIKEVLKYDLLGLIFFSIIGLLVISPESELYNRFLRIRLLQYLGKISYGMYVWHLLILGILANYLTTGIIAADLIISILFSVLVAHLSFHYFESKILKYK